MEYKTTLDPNKDLLTSRETADYFRISTGTLQNWRRDGIIRGLKMGFRTVRYAREEVERVKRDWQKSNYVIPKGDNTNE